MNLYPLILGTVFIGGIGVSIWGWRIMARSKIMKAWPTTAGIIDQASASSEGKDTSSSSTSRSAAFRRTFIGAVGNEGVMAKYLEGETPSVEEIKAALRKGTIGLEIFPVFLGSSLKNKGVQLLLDAVVDYLPSPMEVPPIMAKTPEGGEAQRLADPEGPLAALAFKIMADPYVGRLTFIRVYSGTLRAGTYVLNSTKGKRERVARLLRMHANHREEVEELRAGDLGAVVGLKEAITGDTLVGDGDEPVILESIEIPEPVISVAIEPKTKADQEKLGLALSRLAEEDPTFRVNTDPESGQTIISGMGELHLDIIVDRLRREFKVDAAVGEPQVAYRETITTPVDVEGKFIRQSGGRGQYGHVKIKAEPLERGAGFTFENAIVGGIIPKEFIPAAQKGMEESLASGPVIGFPVVDLKVTLYDGSYHDVDSSEMAFKIAGSMALREAVQKGKPVILEPIMRIEITTPDDYLGDVVGDLNRRRGQVLGMEARGNAQMIRGYVPLSETFGYATDLRSATQGRAAFSMFFDHYDVMPKTLQEKLAAKR